jgi:hypothetical protein
MPDDGNNPETLEQLCRQASQEVDSKKLNVLIEEIDRLLDEQHKTRNLRKFA